MYISMNWIKDFVDLKGIDLEELINRFTLSTAEVEGIIKYGDKLENVITAKILSIENIPQSKKLRRVELDCGDRKENCLCGAPNIQVGDIVPFAPLGSKVEGMEIKTVKMAGETSSGMCLSERELGISDDYSGVMTLDPGTKLGVDIKEIFDIDDIIFEVDNKSLTNRPDLWGHYGIAREMAALTGRKLKKMPLADLEKYNDLKKVKIKVEDKDKCYRFSSIEVENVTEKKLEVNKRIRLYYCGMRSISLLVDLTNYIMLELGQPMHSYDKKLVDDVRVKSLDKAINFKTLDDTERKIEKGTLMICNKETPIAIAGVMGGANSEISDETNSLLLESANFDAYTIRKQALDIKLRTDASSHYEKSLDPEMTKTAIERYIKLLEENDKNIKIVSRLTDEYVKKYPEIVIDVDKDFINKRIGVEFTEKRIIEILESLEFKVEKKDGKLKVRVPSFRATKDVSMKADLVEEIARIYGYDNIVPETKSQPVEPVEIEDEKVIENTIKDIMALKYGFSEIHTYVWYDNKKNKKLNIEVNEDNLKISNGTNSNFNTLRESLIPSLIYNLEKNIKYYEDVKLFEIARTWEYPRKGKDCIEYKKLGAIIYSKSKTSKQLIDEGLKVVHSIVNLNKNVKIEMKEITSNSYSWINPINSAAIVCDNVEIGYISDLNLNIKDAIAKKSNIAVIEIDIEKLNSIKKVNRMFKEVSKYQPVDIDISVIVNKNTKYAFLEECIKKAKAKNIDTYRVIDIFEDKHKLEDKKSITIRFTLLSNDHTLSGEEINNDLTKLIETFEENNCIIKK